MNNQDERLNAMIHKLQSVGLTLAQSRVFVALVLLQNCTVSQIARTSGVHRVDIYRVLRELVRLRIVEVSIGKPNRFRPIESSIALKHLLQNKKEELSQVKAITRSLLDELRSISGSAPKDYVKTNVPSYLLIQGRERGYQETKRLLQNSSNEVLRIGSANSILRATNSGLIKEYRKLTARGIRARVIAKINRDNLGAALKFAKVTDIRSMQGEQLHLNITIVDRKQTFLTASFDDHNLTTDSPNDLYLLVTESNFASAMAIFFENLWSTCREVGENVKL